MKVILFQGFVEEVDANDVFGAECFDLQMSEIVLDDPDYKAHIEQVLVRQRDFRAGTRVMVKCNYGWVVFLCYLAIGFLF